MAWTNFVITLGTQSTISQAIAFLFLRAELNLLCPAAVGSVAYLMKSDVRRGSGMLKQNIKTIRGWLEEEGSQASK